MGRGRSVKDKEEKYERFKARCERDPDHVGENLDHLARRYWVSREIMIKWRFKIREGSNGA